MSVGKRQTKKNIHTYKRIESKTQKQNENVLLPDMAIYREIHAMA